MPDPDAFDGLTDEERHLAKFGLDKRGGVEPSPGSSSSTSGSETSERPRRTESSSPRPVRTTATPSRPGRETSSTARSTGGSGRETRLEAEEK